MRFVIYAFIASCVIGGATFGYLRFKASYLEDGAYWNSNTVIIKSDRVGRLESQGFDARIYEFTPQTKKDYTCITYSATNKAAMVCLPK